MINPPISISKPDTIQGTSTSLSVKDYIKLRQHYTSSLVTLGITDLSETNSVQRLQLLDINTQISIYGYALANKLSYDEADEILGELSIEEFNKEVGKFSEVITSFTRL